MFAYEIFDERKKYVLKKYKCKRNMNIQPPVQCSALLGVNMLTWYVYTCELFFYFLQML